MQKPAQSTVHEVAHAGNHASAPAQSALHAIQEGTARAATLSKGAVRRSPLLSLALAFSGGAVAGALGYRLLGPRPERTLLQRLGLSNGARKLARLF